MVCQTRRRKLLRRIPVLSRFARALDRLESENQRLQALVTQCQLLQLGQQAHSIPSDLMGADGLPLPPPLLRHWVAGADDASWFLESGTRGVQTITGLLAKQQVALDQFESILDFGCGCGRVIRHLAKYDSIGLHGCDYNRAAIAWCDEHLNFGEFSSNLLTPPTRYRRHSFDLIYGFSVFTHLTEQLQILWMDELRRILRPDGYLIITVHGEYYRSRLSDDQQEQYRKGNLVVIKPEEAGRNECGAYHPEGYVRDALARGYNVIEYVPQGALGNPYQDAYMLQSHC